MLLYGEEASNLLSHLYAPLLLEWATQACRKSIVKRINNWLINCVTFVLKIGTVTPVPLELRVYFMYVANHKGFCNFCFYLMDVL